MCSQQKVMVLLHCFCSKQRAAAFANASRLPHCKYIYIPVAGCCHSRHQQVHWEPCRAQCLESQNWFLNVKVARSFVEPTQLDSTSAVDGEAS